VLSTNQIATSDLGPSLYRVGSTDDWYRGPPHSVGTLHDTSGSAWLTAPDYGWTESPLTEIFFLVATAIAVPVWIIRLARRFKRLRPSRADRFTRHRPAAASEVGTEPLLTKE
jgi:hypothetical protein